MANPRSSTSLSTRRPRARSLRPVQGVVAKQVRQLVPPESYEEFSRIVQGLPRDVGAALLGVGALGILIPGPIPPGSSFVALGVLFCWPRLLMKFGKLLALRCPKLFRVFVGFVSDLAAGLERRYPRLA